MKFEDFLKAKHAEDYVGTDDDMPDAFDHWISSLDVSDIMDLAETALSQVQSTKETHITPMVRLEAIMAKISLLKLKADDYNWQMTTSDNVKMEIEKTLVELDALLTPPPTEPS